MFLNIDAADLPSTADSYGARLVGWTKDWQAVDVSVPPKKMGEAAFADYVKGFAS